MMKGAVANVTEAIGGTPIVRLNQLSKGLKADIYCKLEYLNPAGSMKDRIGLNIINQAENYGLSDLHQMRGRVGRSNRKAFCYLFAPHETLLSRDARKRLKAIEEFTDLGSGFHIALKDLDMSYELERGGWVVRPRSTE